MNLILRRVLQGGAVAGLLLGGDLAFHPVRAHGAHGGGGEELKPGEFTARPVVTIEGHGGFETNLEGRPEHYAIDGQFGAVLEWGLPNKGSFAIEAQIGPSLVWGEAEHFYGRVHVEEGGHGGHGDDHGDEHGDHAEDHGDDHGDHAEDHGDDHGDDHSDHEEGHGDSHAGHEGHGHGSGAPFRRTDIKGFMQARYQPNDRLELSLSWWPYYVTGNEGEDSVGLKNEVGAKVVYAFGDGDLNFALGDGLESVLDGVFVSVENRSGWETDGLFIGNYTDTWLGFGFFVDQLNVTLTAGPRFYSPGDYSGLPQRTDWGGEIGMEYPLADSVVLFAHWKPIYSTAGGEGWGKGWSHHVGTGVSFSF
ncbi:hypothetical protein OAF05_00835 [bacterium]|nr:hypothetical protein [bacterium]